MMDEDQTEAQCVDAADPAEPSDDDITVDPISRVSSRVVPRAALRGRQGRDPRLAQARRTFAALVASAGDPQLGLNTEFDLVGVGRLRTTLLDNFSLVDHDAAPEHGFSVNFAYRGAEPLVYHCASDAIYKSLSRRLFDHGLRVRGVGSAVASKLVIDALVPASVSLCADRGRDVLRVTLRNVVMLGSTTYELPLAGLDRSLVDALLGLITGHSRAFYALTVAAAQRRRRD